MELNRRKVAQGSLTKNKNMKITSVSIPCDLFEDIHNLAVFEDRSFSAMLVSLAKKGLKALNVPK